jgi:serine/threonine protein kinase
MSVNEVQALGTLAIFGEKSQNIIRYYHSWIEENDLHIVMEYCGNSLTNFYREVKF